jgi:hypothetical protein
MKPPFEFWQLGTEIYLPNASIDIAAGNFIFLNTLDFKGNRCSLAEQIN